MVLDVSVSKLNGESVTIQVDVDCTVRQVKKILQPLLQIPASAQILFPLQGGTVFSDTDVPFAATEAQSLQVLQAFERWLEEGDYTSCGRSGLLGRRATSRSAGLCYTVSLVKHKGFEYVVTSMRCKGSSVMEKKAAVQNIEFLISLQHPNIAKIFEVVMRPGRSNDMFDDHPVDWIHFSMDYFSSSLASTILHARKPFTCEQLMEWFGQALLGLQYLHSLEILHNNLKCSKLFLTENNQLQIGGLASYVGLDYGQKYGAADPLCFIPSPEQLRGKPDTWHCEIWAMGCILFSMCSLKPPYNFVDMREMVSIISKNTQPLPLEHDYDDAFGKIYRAMLSYNCEARPCTSTLLQEAKSVCEARSWRQFDISPTQARKRPRSPKFRGLCGYKLRFMDRCETAESLLNSGTSTGAEKEHFNKVVRLPPLMAGKLIKAASSLRVERVPSRPSSIDLL